MDTLTLCFVHAFSAATGAAVALGALYGILWMVEELLS